MRIPPETPSFSDQDADAVAESLKWQVASARAAAAKHCARLKDQLETPLTRDEDAAPSS